MSCTRRGSVIATVHPECGFACRMFRKFGSQHFYSAWSGKTRIMQVPYETHGTSGRVVFSVAKYPGNRRACHLSCTLKASGLFWVPVIRRQLPDPGLKTHQLLDVLRGLGIHALRGRCVYRRLSLHWYSLARNPYRVALSVRCRGSAFNRTSNIAACPAGQAKSPDQLRTAYR